jgi:hypothetical protein
MVSPILNEYSLYSAGSWFLLAPLSRIIGQPVDLKPPVFVPKITVLAAITHMVALPRNEKTYQNVVAYARGHQLLENLTVEERAESLPIIASLAMTEGLATEMLP